MKYDFTGMNKLKELDLSYSRIYDINVSGLKNLQTLNLYNCYKLDQLTIKDCPNLKEIDFSFALPYFVDFSGLTSLEKVTAQHSGYLLDVNLTGCTNLRELDLSEANLLPALDLSDCMKLERLDVDSTLLISLDVSGHKNLRWLDAGRCLILKVIDCSNCALEYLNLLCDYSLEEVYCSENNLDQIKVINLSSLKTLDCKNNNMTFLNLDDFQTLESLDCSGQVLNKEYWKTGTSVDMGLYVGKYAITLTNSSGDILLETTTLKKIIDVQGYDSNGEEIETSYDAETGFATFSTAPDRIEYIYDTGSKSDLNVTLASKTDYEPSEGESRLSGTSGGCNSYRSISGILALMLFAWKYILEIQHIIMKSKRGVTF